MFTVELHANLDQVMPKVHKNFWLSVYILHKNTLFSEE